MTPGTRIAAVRFAAGLIFLGILLWAYSSIDPVMYQFRDDGIITLSHGRNWVDFGFIGVNPSGERLEGTSAPLQMLLYAAVYAVTHASYGAFDQLQTLLCTFALGWLVAALFPERPWFALVASATAAFMLTRMGSFMVWHASGMENALMHVFLLWTVLILYRGAREGRIDWRWATVPFLASIARVEAIYYVGPLLAVFCVHATLAGRGREARQFAAVAGGLWLAFSLCRYLYFGSLLPNTAIAQGISVGDRLVEFVTLSPTYMDQSFALARVNFSRHGGYLLLLVVPLLLLRARSGSSTLLLALATTVVLSSLLAPFVFGPARLDTSRTTTHMALFVLVAIAATLYEWRPQRADRYSLPVMAAVVFVIHDYASMPPYSVCCGIREFDATRVRFEKLAREQDIPRPTVANPDLGVMTWHKQFNVVDLGFLGSSVTAHLTGDDDALRRYILDFAAPDMIESHGWWSCRYAAVLGDPRFRERYVFTGDANAPQTTSCKGAAVPTGIWMRRDVMRGSASAERALMDDLARLPTVERVQRELAACRTGAASSPDACAYVARGVYRMLPEFRAAGAVPALERTFASFPAPEFSLFLLRGSDDATAYRLFIGYLQSALM